MRCIIHRTESGGVGVVNPAPSSRMDDEDESAWLDRVKAVAVPDGVPFSIVDAGTLPDRSTRSRWRWSNGTVVIAAEPLDQIKIALKKKVDADAERTRLQWITPGDGMALTYKEKHEQAQAVEAMGEAAANALSQVDREARFPTLAASVGIEASTLWGCAVLVIQRYEQFAALSGTIERARLGGKKAISDASDGAAANAAYEAITWPTP